MGEKRKYKQTPFNKPANHQFRSPEIAKNVVITNAEMDPIKSNIDGQAMTGTFDKPIIVASAFFDILTSSLHKKGTRAVLFAHFIYYSFCKSYGVAKFRLPEFYIVTNLNCRSKFLRSKKLIEKEL